jgi:hypothetical protein
MRHTWFKDEIEFRTSRTEYSWIDQTLKFFDDIKIGLEWHKIASVDLKVGPSSSFRTWSKKEIDPIVHKGEWKVEIAPTTNPDKVLCTARFRIK